MRDRGGMKKERRGMHMRGMKVWCVEGEVKGEGYPSRRVGRGRGSIWGGGGRMTLSGNEWIILNPCQGDGGRMLFACLPAFSCFCL